MKYQDEGIKGGASGLWRALACMALIVGPVACFAQQPPVIDLTAPPGAASAPKAGGTGPSATGNGYAETLVPRTTASRKGRAVQPAQPYTPIKKLDDEGQVPEIEMFVGESRVFPSPGVARIAVGNGSLLTAAALDGKEVILFANGAGTSSLFVWNADGRYQRVKINIVPGDTSRLAREIAAFLSTIPRAKASIVGANIIVDGDELSDADLAKIDALAKRYPQIVNFTNRVGWEQMVMMDVKVVEFPRSLLTEMGIKWNATGGVAVGGIWEPGSRGNIPYEIKIRTGQDNAPPLTGLDGNPTILPRGLNLRSALNLGLNGELNLLAQEGKAAILAEPQLSARSGSKASFLAGGEIPYAVSNQNGVSIQFKSYGIKLEVTPQVDRGGVVRAMIMSEVSSLDRSFTGVGGPGLLSRKTETEFNVRSGETVVLAGLLQRETSADVDKVPWLGDLPVLGALFRSKKFQNKETELVVFVTPTLVKANSPVTTDRVKRTTDRLEERMGPSPYLTEPLQPGASYEAPNAPSRVPAAAASGVGMAPAAVSAAPMEPLPAAAPKPIESAALTTANPLQARAAKESPASAASPGGALLRVMVDNTGLRAEPHAGSPLLMALGMGGTVRLGRADPRSEGDRIWRNVMVGAVDGWVPADAVEPVRGPLEGAAVGGVVATQDQKGRPAVAPVNSVLGAKAATASAATGNLAVDGDGVTARPTAHRFRVALDKLPLRVAPDMNAGVLVNARAGQIVDALPTASRGAWTAVEINEGEKQHRGWMATQWLDPVSLH